MLNIKLNRQSNLNFYLKEQLIIKLALVYPYVSYSDKLALNIENAVKIYQIS